MELQVSLSTKNVLF